MLLERKSATNQPPLGDRMVLPPIETIRLMQTSGTSTWETVHFNNNSSNNSNYNYNYNNYNNNIFCDLAWTTKGTSNNTHTTTIDDNNNSIATTTAYGTVMTSDRKSILDISNNNNNNGNDKNGSAGFQLNIPRFLSSIKEEAEEMEQEDQPNCHRHTSHLSLTTSFQNNAHTTTTITTLPSNSTTASSSTRTSTTPSLVSPPPTPSSLSSSPSSSLLSSPTLSLSSSSSPSSSSPSSSSSSSFTATNYSPSNDKLYLLNNSLPQDSLSAAASSIRSKGSSNMQDIIDSYKLESAKATDSNDISDHTHIYYNNHNYDDLCEYLNGDPLSQSCRLPEVVSPRHSSTGSEASGLQMMTFDNYVLPEEESENHLAFETLKDVRFDPFEDDILRDILYDHSMMKSFGSEEEEDEGDASLSMSDGGDSLDHTRSSPISNASSFSEWPRTFEHKLPVFEQIQVSPPESEKRPRKRSTPSQRQKRKSSDGPAPNEKERKKPGRKPGQVSNVLHLWEFMRDLLHDPTTSDGIIQWVSKPDGVFRVVNSTEVARLWGQKKNNKKEMTYEKLSRSLRYSRIEGYFASLPKDKNYPKKLCFKFGPKSAVGTDHQRR